MDAVVILEWQFSPPDYFGEKFELERQGFALTIGDGKAEARIEDAVLAVSPSLRSDLHEQLDSLFLAVQLLTHASYQLSQPTMVRLYPDGKRDISAVASMGTIRVTGRPVEFVVRDRDGNIVADSRRERIARKREFGELVGKHFSKDPLLRPLLQSYGASIQDPLNELVHLYEIRDALSTKFSGKKSACAALAFSYSDWDTLGRLCNYEPLRQGRHRGQKGSLLREATEDELREARRIARQMIEAYVGYLDAHDRSGSVPQDPLPERERGEEGRKAGD